MGINFLDTGDYYGMGHNELLIREALKERIGQTHYQRKSSVHCVHLLATGLVLTRGLKLLKLLLPIRLPG